MVHRALDPRFALLFLVVAGGCHCGEDPLLNARAKLTVTPVSLDFGEVVVGDVKVLGLEIKNAGQSALRMKSSDLSPAGGEFAFASAAPTDLMPEQKVQVSVAYQPRDLAEDLGTITFSSDDGMAPIVVSLRGVGVESGVGVTIEADRCNDQERSISFGSVRPGMAVERQIHLQVRGPLPVKILSAVSEPGTSPELSIDASALPKTLAPGEELALTARYAPVDGGPDMGAFVITTDSASTPSIRIPVCGTGIAPALCARPVPLDLGSVGVGQTVSGRLTLESCGTEPVKIEAIALSMGASHPSARGFRLVSTPAVPVVLPPSETIEVAIAFDAQPPFGRTEGWIQASSNAAGMPESYFPILARVATPCALSLSPAVVSYRNVAVGMSLEKTLLVANNGEMDCTVASIATSTAGTGADFSIVAPPATPLVLSSGQGQIVRVAFRPSSPGPESGTLSATDGGGNRKTAALHGNPPASNGCEVDIAPTVVNFGLTEVGSIAHQTVRVRAVGRDPCTVSSSRLIHQDPAFATTLPLLRTAFPNVGSIDIDVAYGPTTAMPSADILEITIAPTNMMGGGTYQVGLFGTAGEARICVAPPQLDFGTVPVGTTATQNVSITSCGAVSLGLRGIVLSSGSGPFRIAQQPSIPSALAPGTSAAPTLEVMYAPADPGPHFGLIEILSTDHLAPSVRIPLSGNRGPGCDRVLQCSPPSVDFGDTAAGAHKIVRVVCRSLGTQPVTINTVSLTGGPPALSVSARTPVTIPPGGAWSFDVAFAPSAPAPASATLAIGSNACITPPSAPVAGNGTMRVLPPCQPPMTFSPVEQWSWHTTSVEPRFTNVWSTPLVANLNDDNRDGRIDENDIPDVVFVSIDGYSVLDLGAASPGILRVLSGADGHEEFSVTSPRLSDQAIPAIGDLDGDGAPEIVGLKWIQTPPGTGTGGIYGRYTKGTIVALDHEGRLLWESDPWQWPGQVSTNAAAVSIADLDGDGFAEVILGRDVFDHNGHLVWRGTGSYGIAAGDGPHSVVADIDLDGHPEVIAGGTAYRSDGSILWALPNHPEGGVSVGMLDARDPYPEIVLHSGIALTVLDHLGAQKWQVPVNGSAIGTELPAIADFDGDGTSDVAIADGEAVHVYRGTGELLWTAPTMDPTCCVGISAFDFEGDGAYELILHDYGTVYVYRGATGDLLYSAMRPSETAYEMPIIADVDGDNKGELVVALYGSNGRGGIIAYSNAGDSWVAAPRIWNQQAFHVTNVYESGAIPRMETPLSMAPRVFRGTNAACR
jgi:ASPM-SPD-2-Hydin domain-containing protein/centrosomal CEP192-like protein/VCBS repeat protein